MGPWSSVSVAHVHFGEDPVTHLVDLAVIKDSTLKSASPKPQTTSVDIAQPWTQHISSPMLHNHLAEWRLWIPQLPHCTNPSNTHTHTRLLLTSPVCTSTCTARPATCWEALFLNYLVEKRLGSSPALLSLLASVKLLQVWTVGLHAQYSHLPKWLGYI